MPSSPGASPCRSWRSCCRCSPIPLAKLRPRQGRFARIGVAILAYFLYSNLVALAQVWIEKETPAGTARACGGRTCRRCCSPPGCCGARSAPGGCVRRRARRWPDVSSLARYIVRTVLGYTALVLLVLIALGALFLFIGQQDDIGTGGYTIREAAIFVALNLPSYVAQLLPVAALIGTLLGPRASGQRQRARRDASFGCVDAAVLPLARHRGRDPRGSAMVLVSEFVAPPLETYARQLKVFSKYNEFSFAGDRGTWVRDGDTIISVETAVREHAVRRHPHLPLRPQAAAVRGRSRGFGARRQAATAGCCRTTPRRSSPTWAPARRSEAAARACSRRCRPISSDSRSSIPPRWGCATCARTSATCATTISIRVVRSRVVVAYGARRRARDRRDPGAAVCARSDARVGAGRAYGGRHHDRRNVRAASRTLESSGQLFDLTPWIVGWLPAAALAAFTAVDADARALTSRCSAGVRLLRGGLCARERERRACASSGRATSGVADRSTPRRTPVPPREMTRVAAAKRSSARRPSIGEPSSRSTRSRHARMPIVWPPCVQL